VGFRDGTVELRDVAAWGKRATLRGHTQAVLALAFSAEGTRLATGSVDRSIRLWDVASRQATSVRPGRCAPVCGVRFAPGGRIFASAAACGVVELWEVDGGEARERPRYLAHRASVQAPAFSSDGTTLAAGTDGDGVKLRDVATGRERSLFSRKSGAARPPASLIL
jgi:WD40 repeat protein